MFNINWNNNLTYGFRFWGYNFGCHEDTTETSWHMTVEVLIWNGLGLVNLILIKVKIKCLIVLKSHSVNEVTLLKLNWVNFGR